MATIAKYKLDGIEYTPPREHKGLEVLATFETRDEGGQFLSDSVQANITTSQFSFANTTSSKPKTAIDNWFSSYPTEGMPFEIAISNESGSFSAFKGYLDFRTLQYKSDIELICGIKQDNGLASLHDRLKGISMELLEQKNVINSTDYRYIPYKVKNRKTALEKVALVGQAYNIVKTGVDEVHKFLNIASDLTTAGIAQALVNLTVTVINLVLLIQRLVDLLEEIRENFFPPVRYHKGISLKTAIERALIYCGYTLECGAFDPIISNTVLCPSKDDEIGGLFVGSGPGSGILKPGDFGYVASDLFALSNMMYYTKVRIDGSTVQLRPYNDPFWVQTAGYVMPNVKIEQAFVNNGVKRPNYDELYSSRILQYTTDDSDLWTLTTVAEQIAVTTVTPVNVINQNRVLLTDSEQITIPYALAVRNDIFDNLFEYFLGTQQGLEEIKTTIETQFNSVAGILGTSFPALAPIINLAYNSDGVMKVENHFFSTPKIVYLDPDTNRIPANYADIVGAIALQNNYHSYKSFVPGVRNPSDLSDTNSKMYYEGVTIPMGINDFNTLANNSFFQTVNGTIGKFTSIKWLPDKDKAEVDFWIQEQWATNIEETTV